MLHLCKSLLISPQGTQIHDYILTPQSKRFRAHRH